jgi:hypothetical protein
LLARPAGDRPVQGGYSEVRPLEKVIPLLEIRNDAREQTRDREIARGAEPERMRRRNVAASGSPRRRKRKLTLHPVTVETKWGWGPCIDQGWCAVPAALLRCGAGLRISAEEGWLLVQLLDLKWSEGHSTLQILCDRTHLSAEVVHRLLQSLEDRGLLKLIPKPPARGPANGAQPKRGPTGDASPSPAGWAVDLAPLLRTLDDYIMRDGDLSSGYLRLSRAQSDDRPSDGDPE